ncbi:MAG: Trk system potassium transporter TrkA [Oscillospiraceae bacterium]
MIIGSGKIGYTLARQLSVEDHELVLVDKNRRALERAEAALDVLCVEGNGASISVLLQAGAKTAELVIAVTNSDEVNIVCCLIAKKLGAQHTVARIRDTDYFRDAALLKHEVGLDMVINPEAAAAQEIARILRMPSAFSVETFVGGRVDLIGFTVRESDGLTGETLQKNQRFASGSTLVCAVRRGTEVIVPDGGFVPQVGDTVYVVGGQPALHQLFSQMGRPLNRIRSVSVVGGGRIAIYLAWTLARQECKLRVVEQDPEKCALLSELLPNALILQGDGTDRDLLESEGVFEADAFVSLTGRDEENLLIAMNAQRAGVGKVLAKMTRPNYTELVQEMGLESIISPKEIAADQIVSFVRGLQNSQGSAVEVMYQLLGGAIEAVGFTAGASLLFLDQPLRELRLKEGLLVAALVRDGHTIIPDGDTKILVNDRVIVIAKSLFLRDLNDILQQ